MESADEDEGWANVSREEWLRKLDCADLFESDIHNVVLNYLAVQGFQDAAEAFAAEAQLQPEVPLDSVGRRAAIRQSVLAGDVQGAISILQALDGSILLSFPEVHFRLRQQQLCKIIADGEVERAIEFARQVVLPFVDENVRALRHHETARAHFSRLCCRSWNTQWDCWLFAKLRTALSGKRCRRLLERSWLTK
mmetsp:Transcript_102463/g.235070  ORF Transcript_102463/g.235070 Transcript_102463/m.235070 type:complete len:194 (+) Transcript_102463:1624-2205(+)